MIPVRIVTACEAGHIEDFPFRKWIGCTCASDVDAEMYFKAGRSAGEPCRHQDRMRQVQAEALPCGRVREGIPGGGERDLFGRAAMARSRGRIERPCGAGLQTVQRGSSNVYFPAVQSSIYIPPAQAAENEEIRRVLDTPANLDRYFSGTFDGKVNPQVVAAFAAMMEVDAAALASRGPGAARRVDGSADRGHGRGIPVAGIRRAVQRGHRSCGRAFCRARQRTGLRLAGQLCAAGRPRQEASRDTGAHRLLAGSCRRRT